MTARPLHGEGVSIGISFQCRLEAQLLCKVYTVPTHRMLVMNGRDSPP